MVSIQYVGDSHTSILIPGEPQKTRVVNGEIIDIADEKVAKSLLYRGFQLIDNVPTEKEETVEETVDNVPAEAVSVEVEDDGKEEITIEVAGKKKSK